MGRKYKKGDLCKIASLRVVLILEIRLDRQNTNGRKA